MINPIYLALATPDPVPGCGPQYKQALISWHGAAAVGLGRLPPDPRKSLEQGLRGLQG